MENSSVEGSLESQELHRLLVSACGGAAAEAICFQLPAFACVKLVFERGIIQWAPQETLILLSLCFPASAAGATTGEDTQSCSLFWHLCQRKK